MMPQPRRWSRATLPNRPDNRHETDVIEVVRQLRTAAKAVAIRTPSISYCESFAIANPLRFRVINTPSPCGGQGVGTSSGAAPARRPTRVARNVPYERLRRSSKRRRSVKRYGLALGTAYVQEAPDSVARRGGHHADDRHLQAADPPVADERQGLVGADGKQHHRAERDRHDGRRGHRDSKERHEQERDQGNQRADQG